VGNRDLDLPNGSIDRASARLKWRPERASARLKGGPSARAQLAE